MNECEPNKEQCAYLFVLYPAADRTVSFPPTLLTRGTSSPDSEHLLGVGLNAYIPQNEAGIRKLPPISVPTPKGEQRAAMRAASPPGNKKKKKQEE